MNELIGVINERGELVGVFKSPAYAAVFMEGLYAEQREKVGCIMDQFSTVPVDYARLSTLWREEK